MPVSRIYNNGSVIYFQGDLGDDVYVLQEGRVVLTGNDVETQIEMTEEVKQGEFFGVKSSIGHYPREETAQVVGRTAILIFSLKEFEQFVLKNGRLILKMAQVFSKQLWFVHRKVRQVLNVGDALNPDYELVHVAEAFYRMGNIDHACYAFEKYMEYYPDGDYSDRVQDLLNKAREGHTYPNNYPSLERIEPTSKAKPLLKSSDGDLLQWFKGGRKLFKDGNYEEALKQFERCLAQKDVSDKKESDIQSKALFECGRTKLKLRPADAENHFSTYLKRYPAGGLTRECVFHLGLLSELSGNTEKAKRLYEKVAATSSKDETGMKAQIRLEQMG